MIHKISDFDPGIIVIQIQEKTASPISQTIDVIDQRGVDCFAFLREGCVPMVVIDARKTMSSEVIKSLEARGVCAARSWIGVEENMQEALEMLHASGDIAAANVIKQEIKNFDARKICQIHGV